MSNKRAGTKNGTSDLAPAARQLTFVEWLEGLKRQATDPDPRRPAVGVLCVVLALMGVGLIVQISHASTTLAPGPFRQELTRLLTFRLMALGSLLLAFRIGPAGLRRWLPHLVVITLFCLIAVFVPGISSASNGSNRWMLLPVGGLTIQPSELARVLIVLWVADRCVSLGEDVRDMRRGFMPMLLFGLLLFALIVAEPDLGGALLFLLCFVCTMWVGGARPSHVFGSMAVAGTLALVGAFSTLAYVRERLAVWMGESGNEQVQRTVQAMASGDWLGVGLTHGAWRNNGLQYMQTDYAFALVGEELGLIGLLTVVALFMAFAWQSVRLVISLRDPYSALVAFGLLISVGFQSMLHLQVVTGLAPPKGMNLPFISAGGTSILASCLAVGLALGAVRATVNDRT